MTTSPVESVATDTAYRATPTSLLAVVAAHNSMGCSSGKKTAAPAAAASSVTIRRCRDAGSSTSLHGQACVVVLDPGLQSANEILCRLSIGAAEHVSEIALSGQLVRIVADPHHRLQHDVVLL